MGIMTGLEEDIDRGPEGGAILCYEGTGVEEEDTSSEGEEITDPFDPTKIRVESRQMTVDLLLKRIEESEINLNTGFQRKPGIWKEPVQSRLIESLLIRIPLPAFYLDATDDEKWLVVDGLQRLTTLDRFVLKGNLQLSGLEFLKDLNGKTYSELPRKFQRRILETAIIVYLIQEGTPARAKFNIFKRINTEGLPLSPQEIRHALNQGQVTDYLAKLAASKEFKKATDNGIRDDRMADRECVLRFLAFTVTPYQEYNESRFKDLDTFLNDSMAALNKMTDEELSGLEQRFLRAMNAAHRLFDRYAFRKMPTMAYRYPINKAVFEAWSANLGRLDDAQVERLVSRKEAVRGEFMKLNRDMDFFDAISQGTGDSRKVKMRFSEIERLIARVLE